MRVFLRPWMDRMSQGVKDGGATNAQGWAVFRKEPGRRCGYVHGWTVCRKEPRMAVRRTSMDGPANKCSCIIRTSTIRGGRITQGAKDGGATNVHGWAV